MSTKIKGERLIPKLSGIEPTSDFSLAPNETQEDSGAQTPQHSDSQVIQHRPRAGCVV